MDGGNHRCSIISDNQRGQRAHQERCDSNIGYRSHTCHSLRIAVIHTTASKKKKNLLISTSASTKTQHNLLKISSNSTKYIQQGFGVTSAASTTTELLLKYYTQKNTSRLMLKNNTAKITLSKRGR